MQRDDTGGRDLPRPGQETSTDDGERSPERRPRRDTHAHEKDEGRGRGPTVSRRGFLTSVGMGLGAAAVGIGADAHEDDPVTVAEPEEMAKVTLDVNGTRHRVLVEPRWSLLFVLREKLGLTGTKVGCERGECGACTVLVDDVPRYACMTLALEAQDRQITTLEGLMVGEELGPTQQAFLEEDAYQCGYCTPGQVMAAEGLLRADGEPSAEAVRRGMSGNLCRCGAYPHIERAVHSAAKKKAAEGGA